MKRTSALAVVLVIIAGVFLFSIITSQYAQFNQPKSLREFGSFPKRELKDNYEKALFNYFKNQGLETATATEITSDILKNRPDLKTIKNSIGVHILENAPQSTGAANVVTAVLWDYRGYDTIGEATVIFVAVAGIAALFRASKEEEE